MNLDLLSTKRKSLEDQYLDSPMYDSHSSDIQPSTLFDVDLKIYETYYTEYRLVDNRLVPIVREYKLPIEMSNHS